ncbi:hypothetical protein PZB74_13140 [Porifericola rhodea]|uniref:hypothetical protein n=1 Tax=Porifericola rhodea TaxID=930972 RepID=UPI002665C153|nr:hypothetical protein [Porifericola rhodea]WKN29911.1 hypothetical protein PZB74_13140 [Porifericola rhodea]
MSETRRMPWIAKALSGATIGALVGMYVSNTFLGGGVWPILALTLAGAVVGVLFFGK